MGPGVSPPLWPSASGGDKADLFNFGSRQPVPEPSGPVVEKPSSRPIGRGAVVRNRPNQDRTRLVTDAQDPAPNQYRLRLDVDFANLRWKGTVEFDLPEHGPVCRLDADGLTVTAARVDGRAAPYSLSQAEQELSITCAPGPAARVSIDFEGAVDTNALFGLYRSRQGSGYLLTTHCEPSGARRIFPCVDRPDRKASVHLTVRAPAELEVVANTEPVEPGRGRVARMGVRSHTPDGDVSVLPGGRQVRPPRGPVRPGRRPRADAAGPTANRVGTPWSREAASFGRARRYYGVPYPLSKLDLIAVAEHAFGAMENWGAISFQETRLLVDSSSSSFAQRDVFETVAHEIAHQWFGNLVTMSWWDDIWLNESFASLMETVITDRIAPALDPWTDFFLRTAGMAQAMGGDSLRATHPIRVTVHRPEEISQIFDEISYGKGSSVLAMLNRHLGDDRFRAGVTEYLERFRLRNARTDDLWAALERASGEPVSAIAGPWIDRPGFPVVSARIGPKGLELEQRRFSYLGSHEEDPWPMTMLLDVDGQRQRCTLGYADPDRAGHPDRNHPSQPRRGRLLPGSLRPDPLRPPSYRAPLDEGRRPMGRPFRPRRVRHVGRCRLVDVHPVRSGARRDETTGSWWSQSAPLSRASRSCTPRSRRCRSSHGRTLPRRSPG